MCRDCGRYCAAPRLATALEGICSGEPAGCKRNPKAIDNESILNRDCGCKWNCSHQTEDDATACCGGGAFRDCGVFLPIPGLLFASNFKVTGVEMLQEDVVTLSGPRTSSRCMAPLIFVLQKLGCKLTSVPSSQRNTKSKPGPVSYTHLRAHET